MPQAIVTAIMFVGTLVMEALPILEVVFGIGAGTTAVVGALAITAGVVGMSKLMEMSLPRPDSNYARQKTVRTTTAPVKRVYGESLISGPVAFMGVSGTGNQDLWHVIALTGDKSESITDIYLDNVIIPNADINSGNALGGAVNGTTTIFKPIDSNTLVTVYKYLGGQTTASNPVDSEFFKWTSDHKGQGLTYIATKFSFPDNEKIAEVWNKYNPQDIKALVKGMAVYDPRKDSTSDEYDSSLGVSTQRLADSTTWQWSDNPALCLANYILDDDFGMGVSSSLIDWSAVHSAADYADALVSIPGSQTQKRFTCNGVLYGTDSHSQNINKILSSMNGSLVYSSGKYVMQAGQYIAPESDAILTDDDLTGPINITVANTRDSRFNTIKGTHFNPLDLHKKVAFPEVQLTDIATRDAGEVLYKEVELPMTNDVYMCQRLTYQMINRSNDQMLIEFPCNLKALRYTVGDRVKITLDKFAGSDSDSISFNQTPFVILGFNFSAEGGVTLTLLKDTQANYTDMPVDNYSSIASDGSITDGFSGVPAPTNLSSVVNGHDVRLTWDNPVPNSTFNDIIVYQSATSDFSDSSILLRTKSDAVTFVLPSTALTKYYWVRASLYDNEVAATDIIIGQTYRIRTLGNTTWTSLGASSPVSVGDTFVATASGTSSSGTGVATDESAVSAVVGPETVTTTDQVADSVEWIDVDNTDNLRPDNNATVGATLGTNVYDGQAQAYAVGDLLNSNGFFRFTRTSADDNVDAPADASAFNTAFGRNPTDGDIVVVTNTASTPDKQAAYQYDGSTFGTISGFFAGDLIIDDTITAAALSVDELGAITADLGTITGGTLKGGDVPDADAAPSGAESGSFFDLDGGKFVVGDATNNLLFDGSSLSVTGDITATSGSFTGSVSVSSTGSMYGGTMSSFNTGAGFFLGYHTDAYKLSVGDASGEVLTWDGSKLNVEANTVSFATGGEQDYSSESRYTTSQKSATVVLANNSSYFLLDNRRQDLAFPDFIVSYYLGPLTSGTQSSQANARNGIMDSIQVELFYADASTGSPGTWTSFRSITANTWYTDTGTNYVFSNFRVKDSGSYVASLDTRNGILDDYPTMSPFGDDIDGTSVPVGLVDNDYFINIPLSRNTVVLPKGRYFVKVVITVTDGSLSPYPATGSPTATERRVSIPNASSFAHPDFGQAVFVGGAHTTIFTDNNRDNETLIKGGSVYLMSKEGANADDSDSTAIFFGGRGTTGGTPSSAYGPLHGLYFFNDRDSIGSGSGILGSIGNPNFAMYVPYDGSKLTFEGDANFLNGLYINGVAVNAGAVTGPAGSDTQVQYNDGGSLGASSNFTFNDSTNTLTVQNLTVSGTTTTVNTDDLTVKDPNITLNYSTGDSSSTANNAGITIQDAVDASTDASILWKTASDTFEFSHAVTWPSGSSANANTAYTYSQVGHLPLTGGTVTGFTTFKPSTVSSSVASSNASLVVEAAEGQIQLIAEDSGDWAGNIVISNVNATGPAYRHYWLHNAPSTASSNAGKFELRTSTASTAAQIGGQGSGSTALLVVDDNGNGSFSGSVSATGGTLTNQLNVEFTSTSGVPNSTEAGIYVLDKAAVAADNGGSIVFSGIYTGSSGYIGSGPYVKAYKLNSTDGDYSYGLKFGVRKDNVGSQTLALTIDDETDATFAGDISAEAIVSRSTIASSGRLTITDSTGGNGSWTGGILIDNTATTAGEPAIAFKNSATGSNYFIAGLNQDANFAFSYGTGFGDDQNKLTITSDGKVGINGVPDPDHELHVKGDITIDNESETVPSMLHFNALNKSDLDPTARINFWEGDGHTGTYTNAYAFIEYNGSASEGGNGYIAIGGSEGTTNEDYLIIPRGGPVKVRAYSNQTAFNDSNILHFEAVNDADGTPSTDLRGQVGSPAAGTLTVGSGAVGLIFNTANTTIYGWNLGSNDGASGINLGITDRLFGNVNINGEYRAYRSDEARYGKFFHDTSGTHLKTNNSGDNLYLSAAAGGDVYIDSSSSHSIDITSPAIHIGAGDGANHKVEIGERTKGRGFLFEVYNQSGTVSSDKSTRMFMAETGYNAGNAGFPDNYGLSLVYDGQGTTTFDSGFVSTIANGEWGFYGHENNSNGVLIVHSNRAGTFFKVKISGNNALSIASTKYSTFYNGIDIDHTDTRRVRFLGSGAFKGGVESATTAGDMVGTSAVNDLCIRSETNILFATGGNTERLKIASDGVATFTSTIQTTGSSVIVDPPSGDAVLLLQQSSQTLRIDQNSLRTTTDSDLNLFTNGNSPQLSLDQSSGGVGICTNASDMTSSYCKLQVNGSLLNSGSSAAVQINGFMRLESYLFIHDSTNSGNSVAWGYSGGKMALVSGEGAGTTTLNVGAIEGSALSITSTSDSAIYVNGSGGGIYLTGGNNRIVFGGYRGLEGTTTGTFLDVGEQYDKIRLRSTSVWGGDTGDVAMTIGYNGQTGTVTSGKAKIEFCFGNIIKQSPQIRLSDAGGDLGWTIGANDYADNALVIDSNNNGTAPDIEVNQSYTSFDFAFLPSSKDFYASGNITAYSDRRIKDNIETIDNALDRVMNMRGVFYTRKDLPEKGRQTGVIAQEMQAQLEEVVSEDSQGMLTVSYGNIVGTLIEAIKEQQQQIANLKQTVEELKKWQ